MHPEIQVHEPLAKSWNEPQIIVTRQDIIDYENSQKHVCAPKREYKSTTQSENQSMSDREHSEQTRACQTSTEMLHDRLLDLRNSFLLSHNVMQPMQTPKKQHSNTLDSYLGFKSSVSTTNSHDCDRISPRYSLSRSLPTSPEVPNMTSTPAIHSNAERHFNFETERLRFLKGLRRLSESDDVDNGFRLSKGHCHSPEGIDRCHAALHMSPLSPKRKIDNLIFEPEIRISDARPLKAKRKLDMDDPYPTSVKRAKSDLSQEAGLRYVNQLELDLMFLKDRIQSSSPKNVKIRTTCACTEMEKHFMEMATSAYKSIRRYDGTMHSFEQFKEELTQTNEVIKDSMELLQNVRRLCVH